MSAIMPLNLELFDEEGIPGSDSSHMRSLNLTGDSDLFAPLSLVADEMGSSSSNDLQPIWNVVEPRPLEPFSAGLLSGSVGFPSFHFNDSETSHGSFRPAGYSSTSDSLCRSPERSTEANLTAAVGQAPFRLSPHHLSPERLSRLLQQDQIRLQQLRMQQAHLRKQYQLPTQQQTNFQMQSQQQQPIRFINPTYNFSQIHMQQTPNQASSITPAGFSLSITRAPVQGMQTDSSSSSSPVLSMSTRMDAAASFEDMGLSISRPFSAPTAAAVILPLSPQFKETIADEEDSSLQLNATAYPYPIGQKIQGDGPNQVSCSSFLAISHNSSSCFTFEPEDDNDADSSTGSDTAENEAAPSRETTDASTRKCDRDTSADSSQQRFKPFHEVKWSHRFKELLDFHKMYGHAAVPHTYPANPQLARWVKRQRRQYKLMKERSQASTMTPERLNLLNDLGFIWDSHNVNWNEKWHALMQFKKQYGNANVPSNYADKKLATWVKCQRRQYKLYTDGKASAMSADRIRQLEQIGFEWEIRASANNNTLTTRETSVENRDGSGFSTARMDCEIWSSIQS